MLTKSRPQYRYWCVYVRDKYVYSVHCTHTHIPLCVLTTPISYDQPNVCSPFLASEIRHRDDHFSYTDPPSPKQPQNNLNNYGTFPIHSHNIRTLQLQNHRSLSSCKSVKPAIPLRHMHQVYD